MPSVCFYFQIHQPNRLRRYSVFDSDSNYYDDYRNTQILQKVAQKCYLPATKLILDLVKQHQGRFRVAYCLTGIIVEQFQKQVPQMVKLLQELAKTGCVEFLSETYYHSLAFLYSRDEFKAQVERQGQLMQELFGQTPRVFRNTELIYNNELAKFLAGWGRFKGIIAEGADHVLGSRSPNYLYYPPGEKQVKLLLKNYRLSDDIAFRFSNRAWSEWPLTAEKYAGWIRQTQGQVVNLFIDYETFGEHQWADTGIFDFLSALPGQVLAPPAGGNGSPTGCKCDFKTPSEVLDAYEPVGEYDVPHMISWADTERDLSAWLGNAMQSNALHEVYKLEPVVKAAGDPRLLDDWRRLTTSDHFYYMCTKYFSDGDVHKYFNPYESPYDSYINYMNVLDNLRTRIEAATEAAERARDSAAAGPRRAGGKGETRNPRSEA